LRLELLKKSEFLQRKKTLPKQYEFQDLNELNNSIQTAAQHDFKEMQKRVLEETNLLQEKIKEIESMTAKVKQENLFEAPYYY
jgi:hypothetical protein